MPRSSDVGTPVVLLDPPATPKDPRYPLKADENYQYMLSDAEVDRQAREQPHGKVTPRADGAQAKCPGPRGCGGCRREEEILAWEQTSPEVKIARQMERLRATAEYCAVVEQSDASALTRIEQAMAVMLTLGAPVEAILAYCLHPLAQSDTALATFDPTLASTPTVLMYVMEYRNIANGHFPHPLGRPDGAVSPLPAVNQMLAANKVLGRMSVEAHELADPDWQSERNGSRWLRLLGVDEAQYQRLVEVCAAVAADGVAG